MQRNARRVGLAALLVVGALLGSQGSWPDAWPRAPRRETLWASMLLGPIALIALLFPQWPKPVKLAVSLPVTVSLLHLANAPSIMVFLATPLLALLAMRGEWSKMYHGGRRPKSTVRSDGETRASASQGEVAAAPSRTTASRWQTIRRVIVHSLLAPLLSGRWYTRTLQQAIDQRIAESGSGHLGRIFVALETRWPVVDIRRGLSPLQHARNRFSEMGAWNTERNNGVLIQIQMAERAVTVVADRGIAERVEPRQWQVIADELSARCARGEFQAGLVEAIDRVAALLRACFPATLASADLSGRDDIPVQP